MAVPLVERDALTGVFSANQRVGAGQVVEALGEHSQD